MVLYSRRFCALLDLIMQLLDPLKLPLNQTCLIEASAGTGKTYTMVNLYLRLLLGVGCEPLMVEQILVVTFTKSATQELRDRIRVKVIKTAALFKTYYENKHCPELEQDDFLFSLYQAVEEKLPNALLRLSIAEKELDQASIFTIDGFFQKMLFQFAFDSGVRFDLALINDESELFKNLSEKAWRKLYYAASKEKVTLVAEYLQTPHTILEEISPFLDKNLPQFPQFEQSVEIQQQKIEQFFFDCQQFIQQNWDEFTQPFKQLLDEVENESVIINQVFKQNTSYKIGNMAAWLQQVQNWLAKPYFNLPDKPFNFFSLSSIHKAFAKDISENYRTRFSHSVFAEWENKLAIYQQEIKPLKSKISTQLKFEFLEKVVQLLIEYKATHKEKNFNDLMMIFYQALSGENGKLLANKIRQKFPFSMIDEFQDTDGIQYQIFSQIFMQPNTGFIMIGDPKQSIYKFRGADIFSYIQAAQQADFRFTLNKNWRSSPELIHSVNQLFQFSQTENSAFLYDEIQFNPVESGKAIQAKENPLNITHLTDEQSAVNIYFQTEAYSKGSYLNNAKLAAQCADQIQQQLKRATEGEMLIETGNQAQPLQAKDIAILVRSHKEAEAIQTALQARQLRSVFLSQKESVFKSQEAKDLVYLLKACLNPYSTRTVLTALACPIWQKTSEQLYQLKTDEHLWEAQVEFFVNAAQIWKKQGILPMLHWIFLKEKLVESILSRENGDRKMTNLLHLSELLQSASQDHENESALFYWYQQQIAHPQEKNEEQTLRLETDEDLIKIITYHGSKGLEYPVVWLPFVARSSLSISFKDLNLAYNQENKLSWFTGEISEEAVDIIQKLEYAEDLRLLYVALTRAVHQLHLILPDYFHSAWSAMYYLLSNGEMGIEQQEDKQGSENYLNQKGIFYKKTILPQEPPLSDWKMPEKNTPNLNVPEFQREIKCKGEMTSFSALYSQHEWLQNHRQTAEEKMSFSDHDQFILSKNELEEEPENYSRYRFPRSTKVGIILHHFFEHCDFHLPLKSEQIAPLCEQLDLNEEWIQPTLNWFEDILHTPFSPEKVCLSDIQPQARLNEWQFYLRLANESALPKLNQLMKKYHPIAKNLPPLQFNELQGFVQGFIDCIAQINGKFYLIDYKSNFLGEQAQDYQPKAIDKAMGQHRYDLQYTLYTLALHRYLTFRLGENYQYDRDFGGVAYLFLRGMNRTENSGVYFDKPDEDFILALDQLFG